MQQSPEIPRAFCRFEWTTGIREVMSTAMLATRMDVYIAYSFTFISHVFSRDTEIVGLAQRLRGPGIVCEHCVMLRFNSAMKQV